MRILIPECVRERMKCLPETGMGYQIVDINLSNGRRLRRVVLCNSVEVDDSEGALRGAEIVDGELSEGN